MKKRLLTFLGCVALFSLSMLSAKAQSYQTSAGLGIDFGSGSTFAGPTIKHFFEKDKAIEGDILFGSNATLIQAFFQYHGQVKEAAGLQWYLGGGPGVELYKHGSTFLLRPMAGLDYTFSDLPVALNFDWRPALALYDGGSDFRAGRFGLGFKYIF